MTDYKNHYPSKKQNSGANKNSNQRTFEDVKREVEKTESIPSFDKEWIVTGATSKMVDFAQEAGKYMAENYLTSSKIRSIYGEVKRIQMKEFENDKPAFYLLKPKIAYAVGRDKKSLDKAKGIILFQLIFNKCFPHVTDNKTYKNFCILMEAILAYHKESIDPNNDK